VQIDDEPSILLSAAESGAFTSARLRALWDKYAPRSLEKADLLDEELLMAVEGPYRVYFAPIGAIPDPSARIVFVGLTPGLTQVELCAALHHNTDAVIRNNPEAFSRLLISKVSFGGSMRTNLCTMLDELGVPEMLNAQSSKDLFESADVQIAATSALMYPVFIGKENKNFGGTVDLAARGLFREMIASLLAPRLAAAPRALIVPLGNSAGSGVKYLVDRGEVSIDRVLLGLPHPSGQNGHRKKHFTERKDELKRRLNAWSVSSR
jgi:hypothetical protein